MAIWTGRSVTPQQQRGRLSEDIVSEKGFQGDRQPFGPTNASAGHSMDDEHDSDEHGAGVCDHQLLPLLSTG